MKNCKTAGFRSFVSILVAGVYAAGACAQEATRVEKIEVTGSSIKRIDAETKTYQILNLIGGLCLTVTAIAGRQYGFILLEGSWTVVSAWGVWRVATKN